MRKMILLLQQLHIIRISNIYLLFYRINRICLVIISMYNSQNNNINKPFLLLSHYCKKLKHIIYIIY